MTVLGARAWAIGRNETEQVTLRAVKSARVRFIWFPSPWNFRNTLDDFRWNMRVVRRLGTGSSVFVFRGAYQARRLFPRESHANRRVMRCATTVLAVIIRVVPTRAQRARIFNSGGSHDLTRTMWMLAHPQRFSTNKCGSCCRVSRLSTCIACGVRR